MDEQEQQNTVSSGEQEVNQVAPTPLSPPPHKNLFVIIVLAIERFQRFLQLGSIGVCQS